MFHREDAKNAKEEKSASQGWLVEAAHNPHQTSIQDLWEVLQKRAGLFSLYSLRVLCVFAVKITRAVDT